MLILSIKSADNDILESCTKCLLWCTKLDNIVYIRFLVKMEKDVFSHAINTKQHTAIFGRCAIWLKQVSEGLKSSSVFPNRSRLRLDRFGNTLDDFKPSSTYFSQIAHLPQIAYAISYKILTALGISREIGKLWRAIYSRIARWERAILKFRPPLDPKVL